MTRFQKKIDMMKLILVKTQINYRYGKEKKQCMLALLDNKVSATKALLKVNVNLATHDTITTFVHANVKYPLS